MKINRILLFAYACLLLLGQHIQCFAQTAVISGIVLDADTSVPLPFAHVFINQTTIGTATDDQGRYTLNHVTVGESTLVVSFVGYKSRLQKIQVREGEIKQLNFSLESDDKQLENIEVKGTRDKVWERQLNKFEKAFLGNTKFARSAKILNPWTLDFIEPGNNVLMATSSRPLEIVNVALGYRVFYYLKSMVSNPEGYRISGEVRFEEIISDDPKVLNTWRENRIAAYKGSLRHLLKAILDDRVQQEGFNLYSDMPGYDHSPYRSGIFSEQINKSIQSISLKNKVSSGKNESEYTIQLAQRLEIHYTNGRSQTSVYNDISYPISWLEVSDGFLRVSALGIVMSPPLAVVSGAMYDNRVAYLLPYNYSPD